MDEANQGDLTPANPSVTDPSGTPSEEAQASPVTPEEPSEPDFRATDNDVDGGLTPVEPVAEDAGVTQAARPDEEFETGIPSPPSDDVRTTDAGVGDPDPRPGRMQIEQSGGTVEDAGIDDGSDAEPLHPAETPGPTGTYRDNDGELHESLHADRRAKLEVESVDGQQDRVQRELEEKFNDERWSITQTGRGDWLFRAEDEDGNVVYGLYDLPGRAATAAKQLKRGKAWER